MKKVILIVLLVVAAGAVSMSLLFSGETAQETGQATPAGQVVTITADEFQQKIEREPGVVIDVRTQQEYDEGHLREADLHYDLLNGDFEAHLDSLDKSETYYLYCRSGNRSGRAAQLLVDNGFTHVYNIGGFQDLVAAGLDRE